MDVVTLDEARRQAKQLLAAAGSAPGARDLAWSATNAAAQRSAGTFFRQKFSGALDPGWTLLTGSGVSGGKLKQTGTLGATGLAGAYRALSIPADGKPFRVAMRVDLAAGDVASQANLLIGLSNQAAPSQASVGAFTAGSIFVGIARDPGPSTDSYDQTNGLRAAPAGGYAAFDEALDWSGATTSIVEIVGDEEWYSLSVAESNGDGGLNRVQSHLYPRSSIGAIVTLYVAMIPGNTNPGISWVEASTNRLGRASDDSASRGVTFHWGRNEMNRASGGDGGYAQGMWVPEGYDDSVGAPLAIHSHGYGGTWNEAWTASTMRPVTNALLKAGFVVIGIDSGGQQFGSDVALHAIRAAYRYALARLHITGGVILTGTSMGGVPTANAVRRRVVPSVKGAVLFDPLLNLGWFLDQIRGSDTQYDAYESALVADYGLSSINDPATDEKINGNSPLADNDADYFPTPFRIYSSTEDTLVSKIRNADAFKQTLAAHAPVTVIAGTGAHAASARFADTSGIVTFAQAAIAS